MLLLSSVHPSVVQSVSMCPELMLSDLNQHAPVDTFLRHCRVAANLGVLAALSHRGVEMGVFNSSPDWVREVTESLKHPVLGYLGFAAGNSLVAHGSRKLRSLYVGIGVTVFNFSGEIIQSMIAPITPKSDFLSPNNIPETIKDYAFSFIGAGIFAFNSWRWQKKNSNTEYITQVARPTTY